MNKRKLKADSYSSDSRSQITHQRISLDSESSEEEECKAGASKPTVYAALAKFYSGQKRVEAREVTCVLHPSTLKHYFCSM